MSKKRKRQIRNPGAFLVTVRRPGRSDGPNLYLHARSPEGVWEKVGSTGTQDPAEAERQRSELEARLNANLGKFPEVYTVGIVLEWHLAKVRAQVAADELEASTLQAYEGWVRLLEGYREEDLNGLGRRRLGEIRKALVAGGLIEATAQRVMLHLGTAWRWCAGNPAATGLELPWPGLPSRAGKRGARSRTRTKKRPYLPWELAAVLEEAASYEEGRWLPFLALVADTGARGGELAAARVEDLERDDLGRVFLRVTWWTSKTGEERRLPVLPDVLELLDIEGRTSGPLFRGPRTGRALESRSVRAGLTAILRRLGLLRRIPGGGSRPRYDLDLHSFRRAWKAHADRAGVPEAIRRLVLGHAERDVHEGYGRNYLGDDLHAEVLKVRAWRARRVEAWEAAGRPGLPNAEGPRQGEPSEVPTEGEHESPDSACAPPHSVRPQPIRSEALSGAGATSFFLRGCSGRARGKCETAEEVTSPRDSLANAVANTEAPQPLPNDGRELFGESPVEESLGDLLASGPEVRAALRELASNPQLRRALLAALDRLWPDEAAEDSQAEAAS